MDTKNAPHPETLRELKRQKAFMQTIIKRSDEKHEAAQAARLVKVARLSEQISIAGELEEAEISTENK